MVNENKITVDGGQKKEEQSKVLSKITGFFKKSENNGESGSQRHTRAFHLTRKDSIVSVLVSLAIIGGAVYYGKVVLDEYAEINSHAYELRDLSSYKNINLTGGNLSSYVEGSDVKTIDSLIEVNSNIKEQLDEDETYKQKQQNYYEVLLQNIYLPSLNIWKDPYTKNFNMGVLGQKYLESDKFQDLYLIQYWSDFVKYVGNDADYNTVDTITIGDKTVLEGNSEYFYIPITISFSSPNKRSFLLLVNKLSMTSNQNNIALLNEFFYYLSEAIGEQKIEEIKQLMMDYLEEFSSSSTWDLPKDLSQMTDDELSVYKDRVIGYNLYHWVNGGGIGGDYSQLVDNSVIEKAIDKTTSCNGELNQNCLYNFRNKYRNLPYLAYKVGLENQKDRVSGLLEFLQDLPPVLAITNFGFEKYSNSSFLNNKEEEYQGNITFNAYGRNIPNSELDEASVMLGKLCFGSTSEEKITPDNASKYVDNAIIAMGEDRKYENVSSLGELQMLFSSIKDSYEKMPNYDKMIKLFEIWRMMNDANLCNK